jgi:hypothetical protein
MAIRPAEFVSGNFPLYPAISLIGAAAQESGTR